MPELPEVHTIIEDLKKKKLIGRTIAYVHVLWDKTVAIPDLKAFKREIINKTILDIQRRGKYLILRLSGDYHLLIHLRMTGRLLLVSHEAPLPPYVRIALGLDQGMQLFFHDTRKFGRWYLVKDQKIVLSKMGPEPLDLNFSVEEFIFNLKQRKRALKPLLLDQSFLAGLGNIYVDEALWEAHLHPLRKGCELSDEQARRLYHAIVHVLNRGIQSQGTTLGNGKTNYYRLDGTQGSHQTLLKVFRRTGLPCTRCGTSIERVVIAQRSTHLCPYCQKLAFNPSSR